MLTLTNEELINVYGGRAIYTAPGYLWFTKFCNFLSKIITMIKY